MSAPLRSQRQPFHSLCLRHGLRPGLCSSVPTSVRVNFVPTWNLMPATHFHFKKSPSSRSASFLKPASLPTFVEMPSFFKGSHARAPLVLGASPHISAVPRACSFPFRTSPGSILLCSCSPGSVSSAAGPPRSPSGLLSRRPPVLGHLWGLPSAPEPAVTLSQIYASRGSPPPVPPQIYRFPKHVLCFRYVQAALSSPLYRMPLPVPTCIRSDPLGPDHISPLLVRPAHPPVSLLH